MDLKETMLNTTPTEDLFYLLRAIYNYIDQRIVDCHFKSIELGQQFQKELFENYRSINIFADENFNSLQNAIRDIENTSVNLILTRFVNNIKHTGQYNVDKIYGNFAGNLKSFIIHCLHRKVKVSNESIKFYDFKTNELECTFYKEGYVFTEKEDTNKNWIVDAETPFINFRFTDILKDESIDYSFCASDFINYNNDYELESRFRRYLWCDQIKNSIFEVVVRDNKIEPIINPATPLFMPAKNPNYIEFKDLLEYCFLYYTPQANTRYKLELNHNSTYCHIYKYKSSYTCHRLSTKLKYVENIREFIAYILSVYGHFEMEFELNIDLSKLTAVDKINRLLVLETKYGKMESIKKLYEWRL